MVTGGSGEFEDRRATLIAVPAGDRLLRFDIRMQGDAETVFFDL